MNINEFCRSVRQRAGKTQIQTAVMLGCSQENVSAFECGRTFSHRLLVGYARLYMDPGEIITVVKGSGEYETI